MYLWTVRKLSEAAHSRRRRHKKNNGGSLYSLLKKEIIDPSTHSSIQFFITKTVQGRERNCLKDGKLVQSAYWVIPGRSWIRQPSAWKINTLKSYRKFCVFLYDRNTFPDGIKRDFQYNLKHYRITKRESFIVGTVIQPPLLEFFMKSSQRDFPKLLLKDVGLFDIYLG